jgi:hypothetical protein
VAFKPNTIIDSLTVPAGQEDFSRGFQATVRESRFRFAIATIESLFEKVGGNHARNAVYPEKYR